MTASRPSPISKAAGWRHWRRWRSDASKPAVIVTTVNALLQRVPPKDAIAHASFAAKTGAEVDREALVAFLAGNGYVRAGTVREPGDFALRGGIVDLWPPSFSTKKGEEQPLRLDFFGYTLDAIRRFDAETQLSDKATVWTITLLPASEAPLSAASHQPLPCRLCRVFRGGGR